MNFLQLVSRVTSRRLSGATTTARLSLSSVTHSHTHPSSALPVEPKSFMRNDFINKDGKVVHYGFHVDRSNDGVLDLEVKNPHELDSHITFNEDVHQYYYDGKLLDHTCTGLITSFFEKFDSKMIITKMMSGSNWPRKEYMFPDGTPYTAEDIERQWDRSREYSMNYGTWMHYNIERHFNCLKPSEKLVEMSQFYNFEKLWIVDQNVTPLRTEWKIAAPEWSLGGTIDFVGKKADGSYVIMDWKRSLKLDQNLTNNFNKKGRPPLEHIDDCEGSKYFLQLNLYKRILEKKYNINVSSMVLVSFHQKLEHYLAVEVPVMEYEIDRIIDTLTTNSPTNEEN